MLIIRLCFQPFNIKRYIFFVFIICKKGQEATTCFKSVQIISLLYSTVVNVGSGRIYKEYKSAILRTIGFASFRLLSFARDQF